MTSPLRIVFLLLYSRVPVEPVVLFNLGASEGGQIAAGDGLGASGWRFQYHDADFKVPCRGR